MTHPDWTDEQLSAFLDGELPAADMDALARALETDAALAARIERLGAANTAYVDVVSRIDGAVMTAGLQAAMAEPPSAKVIAFRPRSIVAFVAEHRAIAASLVCAVAVWGVMSSGSPGASTNPFAPGPDGLVMAKSELHEMLESAPTGQVSAVGEATAVPRLTFASVDGAFCRQFEVMTNDSTSAAIACREDQGWRTQVVAYGLPPISGNFQTASAARSAALEAFLDEHLIGAALKAEAEAAVLKSRWEKKAH